MIKYFSLFVMFIGVCAISFGAGFKYYEEYVDKRPCVYNLHSTTNMLNKTFQEVLENKTPYDENSELGKRFNSPSDMAKNTTDFEIYVNEQTGKEFFVPNHCHIGEIDIFGNPVLYKNESF